MNELQSYIRSYFGVDVDDLAKLEELFRVQDLTKGAFHTKIGNRHSDLSFVRSGYLRVYTTFRDKEVTQWIASPGEFITDLSCLMFEQPARWNIEALTDCELFTIYRSDYHSIHHRIPDWDRLEKLFLSKCFVSIEERVFSFLSLSAEERYQHLFETKRALFNQIPLQYLASMLGMTPETFSRIRRKSIS
ncbi:MAG: Crp/Fnr family transcriptional regulator [Flavobacteriales bacterium]|nr:Crp/Fnr family transcriptional regulator [Bacteroidota bacterium]MCB9241048.1 Crp/Fnr family transcriptional regulator [Flavobacteriales bacterium]